MRKIARLKIVAAGPIVAAIMLAPAAQAQTAPTCQFVLGFQALHDALPDTVGPCTENASYLPSGDAVQHTTNGLLAWVKADNLTKFTDGHLTWIDSPNGVVNRLNTDRFSWESPTSMVAAAHIQKPLDPGMVALKPDDPNVPRGFVLSDETTQPSGEYDLTIRSYTKPDQSITTRVIPEASPDAARDDLIAISNSYPKSNRVLGGEGNGFQNDGPVYVGDESTMLESKALNVVTWIHGNYRLEVDDASGDGLGMPIVLAHDVEDDLEHQLLSAG